MRYLIFSDTHGDAESAVRISLAAENIDAIIHLGDTYRDALKIAEDTKKPIYCVKGNIDGEYDADGYEILETEWGNIFLAHGHMESVKSGTKKIVEKAMSCGCKAAFFGHTHIPEYECLANGFIVLNPGSLARPIGRRTGTYAIATIGTEFSAMIFSRGDDAPKRASKTADERFAFLSGFRR